MKLRSVLVALVLGASAPAWALPQTDLGTSATGNSNIAPPSPGGDSEHLSSGTGAPLTSSSSVVGSNALWTLSADSRAHVQAGLIQLYGASTATATYGPPAISYVAAIATTQSNARWGDTFTIDGGALNGTMGRLVVGFQVNGTLASSYDGSVGRLGGASLDQQYRAWLQMANPGGGVSWQRVSGGQRHFVDHMGDRWLATDMSERAPGLWTLAMDFKFGTPIQVDMWGDISSNASAFACTTSLAGCTGSSSLSSTVDFGHTMYWGGISSLTDSFGNAVNNYSVSSASGFDYRYSAVPVPEPSAVMMLLAGFGLVGAIARRRSRC